MIDGIWKTNNGGNRMKSDKGLVCAVCHNPIEDCDYSGQTLTADQNINLTIMAMAGGSSLPVSLEVHGGCLKELRDKIVERNKGSKWM